MSITDWLFGKKKQQKAVTTKAELGEDENNTLKQTANFIDDISNIVNEYERHCLWGTGEDQKFAIDNRLYKRIKLDNLDLMKWFLDKEMNALLSQLVSLPRQYHEYMYSLLTEKLKQILLLYESKEDAHIYRCGVSTDLYSFGIGLIRNDYNELAALYLDTVALGWKKTEQLGKGPFSNSEWLNLEFWRASAHHNVYMKDKGNAEAKQKALQAIKQFQNFPKDDVKKWERNIETFDDFLKTIYLEGE